MGRCIEIDNFCFVEKRMEKKRFSFFMYILIKIPTQQCHWDRAYQFGLFEERKYEKKNIKSSISNYIAN